MRNKYKQEKQQTEGDQNTKMTGYLDYMGQGKIQTKVQPMTVDEEFERFNQQTDQAYGISPNVNDGNNQIQTENISSQGQDKELMNTDRD